MRRFPFYGYCLAGAAAIFVGLTTLWFGLFIDDYLFLATLAGQNPLGSPTNLYVFGSGDPTDVLPLIQDGPYPWFGDPEFRVHFFRPLGSLSMALDYVLFGPSPFAFNLHSLLWHWIMCLAAMLVFRRTLPPAAGVIALLLFILDASHILPAAWWSNRHALIAVGMGFFGVAAHLRWRQDGWRPGLPLSLAAYVTALLASEAGLCTLAYVAAYEMFGARERWRARIAALSPAAVLAITYVLLYKWAGYGAQYSDIYVDPMSDPMGYALAAPGRFLMLAGAQFFMAPVEAVLLRNTLAPLFVVVGAVALAVIATVLYRLWPRFQEEERQALRWLIPGAVLATTPTLAAIVNARVLLAASLGGAAIIAVIIVCLWRELRTLSTPPFKPLLMRAILWLLVVLHVGVAAVAWPAQVTLMRGGMTYLNRLIRNSELDETRIADTQVVVFNAPDPYTSLYPLMLRSYYGKEAPRSWWNLSFAPFPHRVTRTGPREMELEVLGGELLTSTMERLFRSARRPLYAGYEMSLNGLCIKVLEMGTVGPVKMRLLFEKPPEHERYQLLAFQNGAYRRFVPPEPGESVVLPHGFPSRRQRHSSHEATPEEDRF